MSSTIISKLYTKECYCMQIIVYSAYILGCTPTVALNTWYRAPTYSELNFRKLTQLQRTVYNASDWIHICFLFFFVFHPIYYPRTALALPPSSNSDPGSHSGPSSLLPPAVRNFIFHREKCSFFSSLGD